MRETLRDVREGGRVDYRKNIYQEGNSLIAAFRNGDLDEPLLQPNPAGNSTQLLFLTSSLELNVKRD